MKSSLDEGGRVQLARDPDEKGPLLARLRRIEGQVRGVIEMLEADRYCGDELQQIAAARSALREVAVLLAAQHVAAAAGHAIAAGGTEDATDAVMADVQTVLRAAFRQD